MIKGGNIDGLVEIKADTTKKARNDLAKEEGEIVQKISLKTDSGKLQNIEDDDWLKEQDPKLR